MFSEADFEIDSFPSLLKFLPIVIFIGLVAPFLIAAYSLGFVMDTVGFLD